jgi:hypothetical protein
MVFHTSASYFHKNSFHYFKDHLMMKLTLGWSSYDCKTFNAFCGDAWTCHCAIKQANFIARK